MKAELRPHQLNALRMLKLSLGTGKKRPVVQAATGFGKTILGAAIVEGALSKGNRIIFCVPAISLINQTVQSFYEQGITQIGVIQGSHELTDYSKPVQVASVQTLQNRRIPHADVVIVDECHRQFKLFEKWFKDWSNIPFIGLSATPWSRGLGKLYDDLIIASTTQELIDSGYLSDFRVYSPSKPDLKGVRTSAGDYHEGDLADATDKPSLVGSIVENWIARADQAPTICFAVNRAHAAHIQKQFLSRDICAEYIDAYTDTDEREAIAKRFASGEVKVVCNVGCLTTGVDWDVRCIILARPTKSEILFTQMIGRGLRTAKGKKDCLILDHSDTHNRLGFVTDIIHEELCDGKPKRSTGSEKKEALPKECPSCKFMKPAKTPQCPACGFKTEVQSEVESRKGELEEMKRKKKANRVMTNKEKEIFYGELLWYAADHGHSKGWASHKYKAKTGVWPNHYKDAEPKPVSVETLNFIRHENIKWAKSRRSA